MVYELSRPNRLKDIANIKLFMNCSVDLDLTLPSRAPFCRKAAKRGETKNEWSLNIVAQKEVDFEILVGDI